ncbi:hypothetical protein HY440_03315 [Candidatus Microgenomates bacterium]|nr:hypothetical protein [Candidatus Microgenomates bacterium]
MTNINNEPKFSHSNDGGRYTIDAVIPQGTVWGVPTFSAVSIQVDHGGYASEAKRIASELLNQAKSATKKWVYDRRPLIAEGAVQNMCAGISNRKALRPIDPCVLFPDQECTGNDPLTCTNCSYSPDHIDTGATLRGQQFIGTQDIRIQKAR